MLILNPRMSMLLTSKYCMEKNIFTRFLPILTVMVLSMSFFSCSKDDGDSGSSIPSEVYGTWSGSLTTSATGTVRSMSVTFGEDRMGTFTYSSCVYYRVANFSYSMSGSTITCKGVIAGEDGVTNDFNQQFEYHTTYIKPIGSYSDFTLSK